MKKDTHTHVYTKIERIKFLTIFKNIEIKILQPIIVPHRERESDWLVQKREGKREKEIERVVQIKFHIVSFWFSSTFHLEKQVWNR